MAREDQVRSMYRVLILSLMLAASLDLRAFAQAPAQKPPAPPAPQEEPPPPLAVPPTYRYDAHGRRDPFINPVPKPVAPRGVVIPSVRPAGLKGVLVAEINISGVVTSKEPSMNVAILTAPGGKTYFAHPGEALFDAIVKEIRQDAVTFTVTAPGGGPPETPREIVRKVRPAPGENK